MWHLAEHLGIAVVPLSDLSREAPEAVSYFGSRGKSVFSGVTVFEGTRRMIVFNDAHAAGRQASNIAHELSHGLLHHPRAPAMDGLGCRFWNRELEDEANWLSGALLVPEEATLLIVQRDWCVKEAAAKDGVTPTMIRFRINVTGARVRVQRSQARYAGFRGSKRRDDSVEGESK
ncbi:MAG: ImmA/IrrE family metallo-endopeptidase [Chloroflexi bacterium]|nr:ImmA/IrrE family metallo-endopeptidase [Chloroflexota bacterium]